VRPFRRFGSARQRFVALWADAPVVFFAVVVGVALTFRVAIGWARGERTAEPEVEPAVAAAPPSQRAERDGAREVARAEAATPPSRARAAAPLRFEPDPAAAPLPSPPARRARPKSPFPRHRRAH
jgi:hypothetical protein